MESKVNNSQSISRHPRSSYPSHLWHKKRRPKSLPSRKDNNPLPDPRQNRRTHCRLYRKPSRSRAIPQPYPTGLVNVPGKPQAHPFLQNKDGSYRHTNSYHYHLDGYSPDRIPLHLYTIGHQLPRHLPPYWSHLS